MRTIMVREGQRVTAGQPLFQLDMTAAEAQRNRLRSQLVGLRARMVRLQAERDERGELFFPASLQEAAAAQGSALLLDEQAREFAARLQRHHQEQSIMEERTRALRDQIDGVTAQNAAVEQQLDVVRDELARKQRLLDKGLTNRSEYTALLRSEADLVGQVGQTVSTILSSRAQISEAKQQLARLGSQRVETAVSELNDIRAKVSDSEEQLRAADDVLKRTTVLSPSDGIVLEMNVNATGSVVRPGDTMLELLPTGDDLLVEARVSPSDVDVISLGQPARLRFSSLNRRSVPTIDGTVTYLSADRLVDPATRQPYYMTRLQMTSDLPLGVSRDQIYPGMPVETYISTGDRTFFEYLVKPITDSFSRAFLEE